MTMLTTDGPAVFAMFRNVDASSVPVSGALFAAGTESVPANEAGARSSRDAITIPTTTDARAMSTP
jgi:hypothetical protein